MVLLRSAMRFVAVHNATTSLRQKYSEYCYYHNIRFFQNHFRSYTCIIVNDTIWHTPTKLPLICQCEGISIFHSPVTMFENLDSEES